MRIYNTLKHKKQLFKSIAKGKAGIYSCGPTVYNYAHIGNMRTYMNTDLLKRTLMHEGYEIKHVMNTTDVGHLVSDANLGEDKMRTTAGHEHKSIHEIAKFYTDEFLKDMKRLNLIMPEVMPKPSDHIKEILTLIERLDKRKCIYQLETGAYFDTSKFKNYGQLMNLTFEELNNYLISGVRVERPHGLKNNTDFAVWRTTRSDEKDMIWETKYGRGFPGWHIECSAMSMKYLGEHFDLHTSAVDHIPIHHTNEIAQSESATGKKFVNFWVHSEFLLVNGRKMSKSLGNVYRLQDMVDKGYSINSFKYLMLTAHYRTQLNFTFEALENAEKTLNGIYAFIEKLSSMRKVGESRKTFIKKIEKIKNDFFKDIQNDLNTPLALAKLHKLIYETNKVSAKGIAKEDAEKLFDILEEFDKILNLDLSAHAKKKAVPDEVIGLIAEREKFRKEKKFTEADKIRNILREKYNVELEDTSSGVVWRKGS